MSSPTSNPIMKVLRHEHTLTLIDFNPKYPHFEQVYDDEYDLIIKEAFKCQCNLCFQEINFLHRYYYKCDQCDYSLHRSCAELPTTLEHASHCAHSFILTKNESQWLCHMCNKHPLYKQQLCYHCSQCMLNICLDCGTNKMQHDIVYHPSHKHPLVPIYRDISTCCDACGKKHDGFFYMCTTCCCSFIHNVCVFMPKRLLVQDGTFGRFLHTHPLCLTYSFPKEDQKARFYPTCRVCEKSFSGTENLWVYKCEKCRYYAHLDCANLSFRQPDSTSDSAFEPSTSTIDRRDLTTTKNYEDGHNVLRLPLPEQTYNIFIHLFSKGTNEMRRITHNSHEHPLILVDTYPQSNDNTTQMNKVENLWHTLYNDNTTQMNKGEYVCNGCVTPIMDMPFYMCTHGCNYVLHEWCTRLPAELKCYIGHQQHTLILWPKVPRGYLGSFRCGACSSSRNGFAYSCLKCDYFIDVWCALVPRDITHKSHPPHRLSRTNERLDKDYCRMCLSGFMHPKETSLSCKACNFHLHLGCAFFLRERIRHKYDKHPWTLTYSPVENHEGDYFCEVCEEELNPNACFYHCHECLQSMHTSCAPLIPQKTPNIMHGSTWEEFSIDENIKYGSIKSKFHPHPLSLFHFPETQDVEDSLGRCPECFRFPGHELILKCLQCRFYIHYGCAGRIYSNKKWI
ncbi:putative chromatin regulator PHD family [Helianthus annuus]|nr:putative chromatin regulator PHD family [Helianthus annuus]